MSLTHLDETGRARMVDVGEKPDTERTAVAKGEITMRPETLRLIVEQGLPKGDVLAVAQVAGIMAAKRTPDLIPLCHPILLTQVDVAFEIDEAASHIAITATARSHGKTGVEMEALTAVSVAALTIYDMAKAVDKTMRIGNVRLVYKSGGKSGEWKAENGDSVDPNSWCGGQSPDPNPPHSVILRREAPKPALSAVEGNLDAEGQERDPSRLP